MTKSGISSQTWGVKIQRLQGPYDRFVPRVSRDGEFKQADRNWRKTWLHDQHLTSREGSAVDLWDNKEFVKARLNVFRRIWNTPMNLFENGLKAVFNDRMLAHRIRLRTSLALKFWAVGVFTAYWMSYHSNEWYHMHGVKVSVARPAIFPGHPEWPHNNSSRKTKPEEFYDHGFSKTDL